MSVSTSPEKVIKKKIDENRRRLKAAGKPYITSSGVSVSGKQPPPVKVTCRCKYDCKKLSPDTKKHLFNNFYALSEKEQGTYMLNRLCLKPIGRRRNGKYRDPSESKRQCSVIYTVPNGNGADVQICKKTLREIFALTDRRLTTILDHKKLGQLVYEEKRGKSIGSNAQKRKYSDNVIQLIEDHINSFPKEVSHCYRKKLKRLHLSSDLNYSRMFKAFKQRQPECEISLKFYSDVFKKKFPKLKFARPQNVLCNVCSKLRAQIAVSRSLNEMHEAQSRLDLHGLKSEKAIYEMRCDTYESRAPGSDFTVFSMELLQILLVPTLLHSRMFHSRQLSCYNLCIHHSTYNHSYMHTWHEGIGGLGGNEIASCFFSLLKNITKMRRVIIWAENCPWQNKTRMIVFAMVYLVCKGYFDEIILKFFIKNHSFMPCDFTQIEKRKKQLKAMKPSDLDSIILGAQPSRPMQVIHMTKESFFNFAALANMFLNTANLDISKASQIRVTKDDLDYLYIKESFSELVEFKKHQIFKKLQNPTRFPDELLFPRLVNVREMSEEKKRDLLNLCNYMSKEEDKKFYRNLCGEQLSWDQPISLNQCFPSFFLPNST